MPSRDKVEYQPPFPQQEAPLPQPLQSPCFPWPSPQIVLPILGVLFCVLLGTRGWLSLQSAALTPATLEAVISSKFTVSLTHDLTLVRIHLDLSVAPPLSTYQVQHPPLSQPCLNFRGSSEHLSPPCLVSWTIVTLTSVCLLLNVFFLQIKENSMRLM